MSRFLARLLWGWSRRKFIFNIELWSDCVSPSDAIVLRQAYNSWHALGEDDRSYAYEIAVSSLFRPPAVARLNRSPASWEDQL